MKTRSVIPSAYNMICSNRSIGYTFEAAVADIIDNSISAGASKIELIVIPSTSPKLSIVDDGCGMNQNELDNAMTFGGRDKTVFSRDPSDLGRYGLGLKTASLSQCTKLTVVTKKKGKILGGCWDLKEIEKTNSWNYLVLTKEECLQHIKETSLHTNQNGTLVQWENFDRMQVSALKMEETFQSALAKTRYHLELVFHRYLKGEKDISPISIDINGNKLVPYDPFFSSRAPKVIEPTVLKIENEIVTIIPHKLLHPNKLGKDIDLINKYGKLIDTQGFYVYRNKRLIIWGTWFRMAPKLDSTKLCRVQVDLPNTLDHIWELDIKKASAYPPEIIRTELKKIMKEISEIGSKTFRPKKTKTLAIPYWNRVMNNNAIEYCINKDHPLVKMFMDTLDDNKRHEFKNLLKEFETYCPIDKMYYDLQNEERIHNEISSNDISETESFKQLDALFEFGISIEQIEKMEPFINYLQTVNKWEKERNIK